MTIQTRLTLGSVALATLIAGAITAVSLGNLARVELDSTLEQAQVMRSAAADFVQEALNRQRSVGTAEALRAPAFSEALRNLLTASRGVLELAVVDASGRIAADTEPDRVGAAAPAYPDFEKLVRNAGWGDRAAFVTGGARSYYQLEQALGAPGEPPVARVRVVIAPALIVDDLRQSLYGHAGVALVLLLCAAGLAFLASSAAFRPLGRIGRMLDLVARGEYEPGQTEATEGDDELSIIASKVSLLGDRLRGAQTDASDLRGNFDRLLLEMEDAVLVFNRERRVVFASGAVEKLLGRGRHELSGLSIPDVFPSPSVLGLLIEEAADKAVALKNRHVPAADSGPGMLISLDPLEAGPGARGGLLVRLRDPDAQRQIGRELRTADRLTAISRITGGVAHEVKNPLNAILLHVQVARAKLAKGHSDLEPQMEVIASEILRLDRVVKTFLDFTRPVEPKFTTVDLSALVQEIAGLARPQAEAAHIRLQSTASPGLLVRADRDLLMQALLNVVMNGIQAMPGGGDLTLDARADGDSIEVRVSDTGCGIPPEKREKIFRLYYTTKKGGSGIGLAMTFRAVQLHDGTIDFASEPGKGTTFVFRLPAAV